MNIREVLDSYARGEIDAARAEVLLRLDFLERIGNHTLFDHARSARRGIPEIIFGESKSPEVLAETVGRLIDDSDILLVSRASREHLEAVKAKVGDARVRWSEKAAMIIVGEPKVESVGRIGIMTAGTSDIRVAEEAREVAEAMGCEVMTAYDVGVAALHRFMEPLQQMLDKGCDALIVVAGMEGALPSVISGLVDIPVIGVPSSVGYGISGGGQAALMSMLSTCSPGLVVVNIDNGVNAGATAALISQRCRKLSREG